MKLAQVGAARRRLAARNRRVASPRHERPLGANYAGLAPSECLECRSDATTSVEDQARERIMATTISLFDNMGNPGTTAAAFSLGWHLAKQGKRVLLVDCNPGCRLTNMVIGLGNARGADSILGTRDGLPLNLMEGLRPVFEMQPIPLRPAFLTPVVGNDELFLLPGHVALTEYEELLGLAQNLGSAADRLRNFPGAVHHLLAKTASANEIDYMVVDTSPAMSSLDRNIFSVSNYFVVVVAPDNFSEAAIQSLSRVLPKWRRWSERAGRHKPFIKASYPFPSICPKFLGHIGHEMRPQGRHAKVAKGTAPNFAPSDGIRKTLIPALDEAGMMLSRNDYFEVDANSPMLTHWRDSLGQFAVDLRDGFRGATSVREHGAVAVDEAELCQEFSQLVFNAAKQAEALMSHARVN